VSKNLAPEVIAARQLAPAKKDAKCFAGKTLPGMKTIYRQTEVKQTDKVVANASQSRYISILSFFSIFAIFNRRLFISTNFFSFSQNLKST
jgi:hypothetical protein